jgi:splicing factor 3B subunit 4
MTLHLARNQEATVWVGGLDSMVNEQLLWELMLQAGPLVTVHIPRDKITGEHSGYAFVEFASEEDADYAMKIMNMVRLFGKALKINKASRDRKDMDVGANVFVGNLDPDVEDQLLYNTFSAFGQVLSAKVMNDHEGNSKGFGFVNFADFESSDAAIMAMSGQFLCYRPIHVSYAYKKGPKGERKSHERHGSKAERILAKKSQARYTKRPNMRFAAGPTDGPPPIPQAAPVMQNPPPFNVGRLPPPPGNLGMPPPWENRGPPPPPGSYQLPPPPPANFAARPPPIPGVPAGLPPPVPQTQGFPGGPPIPNLPPPIPGGRPGVVPGQPPQFNPPPQPEFRPPPPIPPPN